MSFVTTVMFCRLGASCPPRDIKSASDGIHRVQFDRDVTTTMEIVTLSSNSWLL